MVDSRFLFSGIAAMLLFLNGVGAQNSQGLCSCSPGFMTFRMAFSQNCTTTTIDAATRDGIAETSCEVGNFRGGNPNNTDFVPVRITKIQIQELRRDISVLKVVTNEGSFSDGYTFNYTSVAVSDPEKLETEDSVVGGLQMSLDAVNENEDRIFNNWIILFTNQCEIFPLFVDGDEIGWTVFVDSTLPTNEFCPGQPTETPTFSPTISEFPSTFPSFHPTVVPTMFPSFNPTTHPSFEPSFHPSAAPITPSPNTEPTNSPSMKPTESPVEPTSDSPTTYEPTYSPTTSCPPVTPSKGGGKKSSKSPSTKSSKSPKSGKSSKSPKSGKSSKSPKSGKSSKAPKGGKGSSKSPSSKSSKGTKSPAIYHKKEMEDDFDRGQKIVRESSSRSLLTESPGGKRSSTSPKASKSSSTKSPSTKSSKSPSAKSSKSPKSSGKKSPSTPSPFLCPEPSPGPIHHEKKPKSSKSHSMEKLPKSTKSPSPKSSKSSSSKAPKGSSSKAPKGSSSKAPKGAATKAPGSGKGSTKSPGGGKGSTKAPAHSTQSPATEAPYATPLAETSSGKRKLVGV